MANLDTSCLTSETVDAKIKSAIEAHNAKLLENLDNIMKSGLETLKRDCLLKVCSKNGHHQEVNTSSRKNGKVGQCTRSFKHTEDPEIKKLIEESFKGKENAYCPYSKFPVGAAVLCEDGTIIRGCNVENAVYPLGICAEKTTLSKAASEGYLKFKAIAICSDLKHSFITPCGSCRQILAEFGMDWDVYMTKPDGSYLKMKVRELLPLGFGPSSLEEEKVGGTTMPTMANVSGSPNSMSLTNTEIHRNGFVLGEDNTNGHA